MIVQLTRVLIDGSHVADGKKMLHVRKPRMHVSFANTAQLLAERHNPKTDSYLH